MNTLIKTTVFPYSKEGGNPCPVTLNADHLSDEEMRAVAEKYKAEAGFISQSKHADCDFQFRYFVPNHEMEMCVHATIACATVLVHQKMTAKNHLMIETLAGKMPVTIDQSSGEILVEVEQLLHEISADQPNKTEVADALNISVNDIDYFPVNNISTSRYKTIVKLKSADVLNQLTPDFEKLWQICDKYQSTGFYPFAKYKQKENTFAARQFPNNTGYNEDPATGVAASALGIYVYQHHLADSKTDNLYIIQGEAMNRPSEIIVKNILTEDNKLKNAVIGKAVIH